MNIPDELVEDILAGRVVAFVGAGFSRPEVPAWSELLEKLADHVGEEVREEVNGLVAEGKDPRSLEAAAQLLRDALGDEFIKYLGEELRGGQEPGENLRRRVGWLTGVPFRAILTTNFDGYIPGARSPEPSVYREILRADGGWWQGRWHDPEDAPPGGAAPVVALHGSVTFKPPEVVFSRSDYRRLVHGRSDYRPFLRSLLMTNTVLFLGFSFTDAYINELRSEVQSLLGGEGDDAAAGKPLAYAVLDGVSEPMSRYLRDHEGIQVLPIASVEEGDQITKDFDDVLRGLYDRTNPIRRVQEVVQGKTIAWIDPRPGHNEYGYDVLMGRADDPMRSSGAGQPGDGYGRAELIEIQIVGRWRDKLEQLDSVPDVIITHWGHGDTEDGSRALEVLKGIRAANSPGHAPVIVFAAGGHDHVDSNRREALRHGALAFHTEWAGLFRELELLLSGDGGVGAT